VATFFYNQSLAHLQRFEYQPAQEAKSNADRLARGLIGDYDRTWKYDKGDYAVVDLGLSIDQVSDKFRGTAQGVGAKNVVKDGAEAKGIDLAVSAPQPLHGLRVVFGLVVALFSAWRRRMLTLQCLKCGDLRRSRPSGRCRGRALPAVLITCSSCATASRLPPATEALGGAGLGRARPRVPAPVPDVAGGRDTSTQGQAASRPGLRCPGT
jgi:hypothetical protein